MSNNLTSGRKISSALNGVLLLNVTDGLYSVVFQGETQSESYDIVEANKHFMAILKNFI